MPSQLNDILPVAAAFAPLFSDPVWQHAPILLLGALLARGKRTLPACLRVMGLRDEKHFVNYDRVLRRAVGCTRQGSRLLWGRIVAARLPPAPPSSAAAMTPWNAATDARSGRRGALATRCAQVTSAPSAFRVRWVGLRALGLLPCSSRVWVLPFLWMLAPPEQQGTRHKTSVDWRRQMIRQVRRWQPECALVLVGGGGNTAMSLALTCLQ